MLRYYQLINYFIAITISSATMLADELKLDDYKTSSIVWVATEPAEIRYADSKVFTLSSSTYIHIYVDDLQHVRKGDLLATLNPKQLELETLSLELAEENVAQEKLNFSEETKQQQQGLGEQIYTFKEELLKLQQLSKESLSKINQDRVFTAIDKINLQISQIESKMAPDLLARQKRLFEQELYIKLEKRKQQLALLRRNSNITAPFDCEITYLIDSLKPSTTIWIDEPGQLFSMVNKDKILIQTQPNSSEALKLDPSLTSVIITTASGSIKGSFKEIIHSHSGAKRHQTWLYEPQPDLAKEYHEFIGTNHLANFYQNLRQPSKIVPKKRIGTLFPKILEREGWHGVVKKLWPEATLVQEAPNLLVIEP